MARKFNTAPYFDDFDSAKNFYKVLFKPGVAVQARELNQLQSILQHQITAVGNHIFKKNSIVIPGGTTLQEAADIVSITGIASPASLVGKTITNATSFDPTLDSTLDGYITAVVLGYKDPTETAPPALYVKYFKTNADGRATFNKNETLRTVDSSLITFAVDSIVGSTVGKVATVSEGVFYTREIFVDCPRQSVIVEVDNSVTTNCMVGLQVVESIVTSDSDESLLDNANGSPNQYAPGADRYKVNLVLQRIDVDSIIDDEYFIKLMEITNNTITYLNNKTEYAELMKTLARRTYDANGNFIVNGLDTAIVETSDDDYLRVNVGKGKCYLGGYEYDQISDVGITLEKPRTTEFQEQVPTVVKYNSVLPFLYVAGSTLLEYIPSPDSLVQFINAAPGTVGVKVIGHGIFKSMQFFGKVDTKDIYYMFFDNITLEKPYVMSDIGGVIGVISGKGAPVLHELRLGSVNGTFTPGNALEPANSDLGGSAEIYTYVNNIIYAIKDTVNEVPSSDVVKDASTGATGSVRSYFVTNYTPTFVPLIEVDRDTIKTLYNLNDVNTTNYFVSQPFTITVTTAGTYQVNLGGSSSDVFANYSTSNYFAFIETSGSEQIVDLTGILTISGNSCSLEVPNGSPMLGKKVILYTTVQKVNAVEAKKVLLTEAVGDVIAVPTKSWMALRKQDVVRINKIVDGKVIPITNATWSAGVATITLDSPHSLSIGSKVVVRGIESDGLDGFGDPITNTKLYTGFNGKFEVLTAPSANSFTYALVENPGTFVAGTSNDLDPGSRDAVVAVPPDINSDLDITNRFTFDSGQTAHMTGAGYIKLKKNATSPVGQIGVSYQYYGFQGGEGNYVSVDSYGDYSDADLSYIGRIANVKTTSGNELEIRRHIDFRTRPSKYFFKNVATIAAGTNVLVLRDLNLSGRCECYDFDSDAGGTDKFVVGPGVLSGAKIKPGSVKTDPETGNTYMELVYHQDDPVGTAYDKGDPFIVAENSSGIYYIGLDDVDLKVSSSGFGEGKTFNFPKDSTRFTYQYVKFKPKQVMVFINRQQDLLKVDYEDISSLTEATAIRRNEFKLPLTYIRMAPYTVSLKDVDVLKFENPVYQMLDIHEIAERLDRTEYYASLALNRDIEQEILDAEVEGLTTASQGFWNENFANPALQDYQDNDFKCTVYDQNYVAPGTVTRTINLMLDTAENAPTWKQSGSAITLPYTEERAFGSANASKSNNLNPFNAINWSGKLTLNPSVDNWIDTTIPETVIAKLTSIGSNNEPPSAPVPQVPSDPPVVLPPPPQNEIVTEINNLRVKWGRDSRGGYHAITFDWVTNFGRRGRVNTDRHLSWAIKNKGYDGAYARSLLNKRYNDPEVREYLNAGRHFDQRPPNRWALEGLIGFN